MTNKERGLIGKYITTKQAVQAYYGMSDGNSFYPGMIGLVAAIAPSPTRHYNLVVFDYKTSDGKAHRASTRIDNVVKY